MTKLTLISHVLCPYVQRAVIALKEKGVDFERIDIDLGDKPDWFLKISPLGKVPVLKVGDDVIFESAVIAEFLEDTVSPPLHPADHVRRADHRGWIEFAGVVLADIWGFYTAPDGQTFEKKRQELAQRFERLEERLKADPWFDGETFHLVDAAFGPVFRYFDVFDAIDDFGILKGKPRIGRWRKALKERPSVKTAVVRDYPERLKDFIVKRNSYMSGLIAETV
ncbi:glutathione S-transferase family protein [Taklimakanibacter deserti]|uniref:glutathione S-transferase family protein n=1 Tax=Taklimakanibacter deserti TaxID=2267839 RepID=UPI000E6472EC